MQLTMRLFKAILGQLWSSERPHEASRWPQDAAKWPSHL